MAYPDHLLFTPEQVSSTTLAALKNRSTLARLVNQDFSRDFVPGRGASVTVKSPIMTDEADVYTRENRIAGDAIRYSDLWEPYRTLSLSDQVYKAVQLPDDFTTFTLTDMAQQVVAPIAEKVADRINGIVAAAFETVGAGLSFADKQTKGSIVGVDGKKYADLAAIKTAGVAPAAYGLGLTGATAGIADADLTAETNADVLKVIRAAYRLFGLRGVPQQGRTLVVGAGWAAAILALPNLNKVNEAGTDGLLRDATLGTLYGFTIVTDYSIGAYDAFAVQRDAVTLATRTPAVPRGASFAATTAADGFTLRYLHDYDPDHLTDRAVVDTFAGAEVLDAQRIVRLTGTAGFEEPAAPAAPTEPAA